MSFIIYSDFNMRKYFKIILISFLSICVWINSLFGNNEEGSNSRENRNSDDTLPVELIYFEAHIIDTLVLLRWGTATEISNFGFNVERTQTYASWETLGFVPGNGTSYSPKHYTFLDSTVIPSGTYHYRLKQIDTDGQFKYSDTVTVNYLASNLENRSNFLPTFNLKQNFPNPFNSSTIIQFDIPSNGKVLLNVFNVVGHRIAPLVNEYLKMGSHEIKFDGEKLKSGVYLYRLEFGSFSETKKLILVK